LGTISAFAYRHRETKKNLCRGGRSNLYQQYIYLPRYIYGYSFVDVSLVLGWRVQCIDLQNSYMFRPSPAYLQGGRLYKTRTRPYSFLPLGTTALGEPWLPQQSVSISLCLSSSPSTALSSLLSGLLPHHPSISNEVSLFFFL